MLPRKSWQRSLLLCASLSPRSKSDNNSIDRSQDSRGARSRRHFRYSGGKSLKARCSGCNAECHLSSVAQLAQQDKIGQILPKLRSHFSSTPEFCDDSHSDHSVPTSQCRDKTHANLQHKVDSQYLFQQPCRLKAVCSSKEGRTPYLVLKFATLTSRFTPSWHCPWP